MYTSQVASRVCSPGKFTSSDLALKWSFTKNQVKLNIIMTKKGTKYIGNVLDLLTDFLPHHTPVISASALP